MQSTSEFDLAEFDWKPQPQAASFVLSKVESACAKSPWLSAWRKRLLEETGTRLIDWLDHITIATDDELESSGFVADVQGVYENSLGIFPKILVVPQSDSQQIRLGLKVERLKDFLDVHTESICSEHRIGDNVSQVQLAELTMEDGTEICVVERHGSQSMRADDQHPLSDDAASEIEPTLQSFRLRCRDYSQPDLVFQDAVERFQKAAAVLGQSHACDLFFRAEREYWQSRNQAARAQQARQQALGLGWANHDHHTYRCSRKYFKPLVEFLELTGFECRERFYAGKDAGWGAQVLEHRQCGIIIFADVDLSEEEVFGDFAHEGLSPNPTLGTVGLWCELHGDSFGAAGMHHLECQFDFTAATRQLAECGIQSMAPFTDFPYLKQAFTLGETWQVPNERIRELVDRGVLTDEQAERLEQDGVIGSHLEILERNDGFKGFNQSGISHIIRETNPSTLRK